MSVILLVGLSPTPYEGFVTTRRPSLKIEWVLLQASDTRVTALNLVNRPSAVHPYGPDVTENVTNQLRRDVTCHELNEESSKGSPVRRYDPERPPVFSHRATSPITIERSTALHMS